MLCLHFSESVIYIDQHQKGHWYWFVYCTITFHWADQFGKDYFFYANIVSDCTRIFYVSKIEFSVEDKFIQICVCEFPLPLKLGHCTYWFVYCTITIIWLIPDQFWKDFSCKANIVEIVLTYFMLERWIRWIYFWRQGTPITILYDYLISGVFKLFLATQISESKPYVTQSKQKC